MPSDVTRPTPVVLPDALGWTRWGSLVTLVSGLLMFGLLWGPTGGIPRIPKPTGDRAASDVCVNSWDHSGITGIVDQSILLEERSSIS